MPLVRVAEFAGRCTNQEECNVAPSLCEGCGTASGLEIKAGMSELGEEAGGVVEAGQGNRCSLLSSNANHLEGKFESVQPSLTRESFSADILRDSEEISRDSDTIV